MHIINYMQERPSHSNTPHGLHGYMYADPSIDRCDTRRVGRGARVQTYALAHAWHSRAKNSEKRDIEWNRRCALSYASFRCISLHRLIRYSIFTVIKSLFIRLISSQVALLRRSRGEASSYNSSRYKYASPFVLMLLK